MLFSIDEHTSYFGIPVGTYHTQRSDFNDILKEEDESIQVSS